MSQYDAGVQSPPTSGGELQAPERPTSWPTVIGTCSIVLAALGMIGSCFNLGSVFFMKQFGDMLGEGGLPPSMTAQFDAMQDHKALIIASHAGYLTAALLLLVAGVMTIRRVSIARGLHLGWATLKLLLTIPGTYIGFVVSQASINAMIDDPNMGAQMPAGFMKQMTYFGMGFGVLMAIAYPIFMLIWFNRAKIKSEVNQRWGVRQ